MKKMKRRKKIVPIKFIKMSPENTLIVTETCQRRKKLANIRGNEIFVIVKARAAVPPKIRTN